MEEKNRKSKLNFEELKQSVLGFAQRSQKFKKLQAQFVELKDKFYADMEDYFTCHEVDPSEGVTVDYDDELVYEGKLTVKRVQKSSVEFDADKLEEILGKNLSKNVILKKYEVTDMAGLITYLKECGCDPKVFRSFIQVSKRVDADELDRLEEVGKITADQITGCYEVKTQKSYYTVSANKRGGKD